MYVGSYVRSYPKSANLLSLWHISFLSSFPSSRVCSHAPPLAPPPHPISYGISLRPACNINTVYIAGIVLGRKFRELVKKLDFTERKLSWILLTCIYRLVSTERSNNHGETFVDRHIIAKFAKKFSPLRKFSRYMVEPNVYLTRRFGQSSCL